MSDRIKLLKQQIEKLAVPGLDGGPVKPSPASPPAASSKSKIPGLGGSESKTNIAPSLHVGNDVRVMQNLLLELVHSGFIPATGLPDAKFANGAWGPKTNASLIATANATQNLLRIVNELRGEGVRIDLDIYTAKALEAFKSYIPELKGGRANLTPEEQSSYAIEIEKHLKAIKALNNQFMTQVGSKGEFRGLLAGEPIDQYATPHQMTTNTETEGEVQKVLSNPDAYANIPVSIPGITNSMPMIALTGKEEYLKWANGIYANSKTKPTEEQLIDLFQRVIKPQLDKRVS